MADFQVAVIPIGRVDPAELEAAATRAAKVLRRPLELRESLPVPHSAEDADRGQHRAATFMDHLRKEVLKLKPGKLIGTEAETLDKPFIPKAFIFVTDVDLYTAKTEGVFGALIRAKQCAVISVRRLREAFHRRKANPNKQRSRVVKEILRMAGRLQGLAECSDPECVLAPSRAVPDIDSKEERYCRGCEQLMFEGRLQL